MARVKVPGCGCWPYFPVGLRAYHSRFCTVSPGQPLSPAELEGWKVAKRAANTSSSAPLEQPARPPLLREDEGYVDHWADRDD